MLYVFDLDGTLIDNKVAVYAAYKAAGVQPPHNFFDTPSDMWSKPPTEEQKKMKQRFYAMHMELCKRGPALALWHSLHMDEKMIMTGASGEAVQVSVQIIGIMSSYMLSRKSMPEKVHTLKQLRDFHEGQVFYVDADHAVCKIVSQEAVVTGITFYSGDQK